VENGFAPFSTKPKLNRMKLFRHVTEKWGTFCGAKFGLQNGLPSKAGLSLD
jgi:hypothetical protein